MTACTAKPLPESRPQEMTLVILTLLSSYFVVPCCTHSLPAARVGAVFDQLIQTTSLAVLDVDVAVIAAGRVGCSGGDGRAGKAAAHEHDSRAYLF